MATESCRGRDGLFAVPLEVASEEREAHPHPSGLSHRPARSASEDPPATDVRSEGFLEVPAAVASGLVLESLELAGSRIGPYRIVGQLGAGGMADVFLATRDDGRFERRVAIKVSRSGGEDPDTARRARLECQILARLEHPAIARLYDAGEIASGRSYLVMEHVAGPALDVYCDRRRLDLRARLQLFQRLLGGVTFAHRNRVVHRDIKPQNILVTDRGEPKLLDFGIAEKLCEGSREARRAGTRHPMTLEYASPEQLQGGPITTATDIYSLGVVL